MLNFSSGSRIDDVFVNFIGEAERVKLLTESGDKLHFIAAEYLAGGVVGIADNDSSCLFVEGCAQLLLVEIPFRGLQRNVAWLGIRKDPIGRVVLIERFKEDHFVTGVNRCHHRGNHSFG